jgi:hypothetical protein
MQHDDDGPISSGTGTLGSGWNCNYPGGGHDECVRLDVVMGKVTGSYMYYPPGNPGYTG